MSWNNNKQQFEWRNIKLPSTIPNNMGIGILRKRNVEIVPSGPIRLRIEARTRELKSCSSNSPALGKATAISSEAPKVASLDSSKLRPHVKYDSKGREYDFQQQINRKRRNISECNCLKIDITNQGKITSLLNIFLFYCWLNWLLQRKVQ